VAELSVAPCKTGRPVPRLMILEPALCPCQRRMSGDLRPFEVAVPCHDLLVEARGAEIRAIEESDHCKTGLVEARQLVDRIEPQTLALRRRKIRQPARSVVARGHTPLDAFH